MSIHSKPFNEGTITKLEIFEDYAKEWIPTFVMSGYEEIWIFDFFAGTGYDKVGVEGSPIRILKQVRNQIGHIFNKKVKINLCFNEFAKGKFKLLSSACNDYYNRFPELARANVRVHLRNEDFTKLFPKTLSTIKKCPSLIYFDQSGVKFLSYEYLQILEKLKTTDFLYFISSSYFIRFGNTKKFQDTLKIDVEKARSNPYKYIHKNILVQLREKLSQNTKLILYPFTIKKGSNVYGIIFGASHPRAVDKFLKTAWARNAINGEANFDIDEDASKSQLSLFEERKKTKIEEFSEQLKLRILNGDILTNKDAYDFALQQGHISTHASNEVKKLKKEQLINYSGKSPLINYEQVYRNKRIISFQIVQK